MSFLVDTNVISELARPAPDPGVLDWSREVAKIGLSAVTLDEIYFGLSWKPSSRIQNWFEAFFRDHCELFPVSHEIAKRSGTLRGQFRERGVARTQADMLIAATAFIHDLTLVTRNERDFEGCSIAVMKPFSA